MRATADFAVATFAGTELEPAPLPITTALPTGVAIMEKQYEGELIGRSATIFVSAYDADRGVGTYVAMESFEGTVHGRAGAFNFVHSAATSGADRSGEHFLIVPFSGTGELAGIRGSGGLQVDADGRHQMWFEYELD